jgi:copper chaperone CopZ
MYMDGFKWTYLTPSAECLALFFGSWTIDTPWKLALSCVAAALLGVTMEMVSLVRRQLPKRRQRDVGYLFHGANLCLAYLVMLVIMMYSLELFLSSLVGLVVGHIIATVLTRRIVTKGLFRHSQGAQGLNDSCVCPSEVIPDIGAGSPCCRMSLGLDAPLINRSFTGDSRTVNAVAPTATAEANACLDIKGMTCCACSATVRGALLSVTGVVSAEVSLEKRAARVSYNSPADVVQLCGAVDAVGFEAAERESPDSEELSP